MNLPRARHKLTSLILGGLGALLAAGLGEYLQFFRNMEFTSYDLRVAAASPTPRDDRIVHLNIGDISVRPDQLGRWPWHRDVHARIVDGLTALGAEQIIFDVEFLEPERAYLDPDTAADVELAAQLLVGGGEEPGLLEVVRNIIRKARDAIDQEDPDEADLLLMQLREDLPLYGKKIGILFGQLLIEPDQEFAAAIRRSGRVVLPLNLVRTQEIHEPSEKLAAFSPEWEGLEGLRIDRKNLTGPLPLLADGASYFGAVDLPRADADRIVRRGSLFHRYNRRLYLQLGVAVALRLVGGEWKVGGGSGEAVFSNDRGEKISIPIDEHGMTLLDWRQGDVTGLFPQVSFARVYHPVEAAYRVHRIFGKLKNLADLMGIRGITWPGVTLRNYLDPDVWEKQRAFLAQFKEATEKVHDFGHRKDAKEWAQQYFRELATLDRIRSGKMEELRREFGGKIVLIGSTETASTDLKATSTHGALPGVFFHSTMMNMMLQGRFVRPVSTAAALGVTFLGALIVILVTTFGRPGVTGVVTFLLGGGYVAGTFLLFSSERVVLPVVVPVLAMVIPYLLVSGYQLVVENREKRLVRNMFQHYLSPDLVDRLMRDPEQASLGGARRYVTVFFSDVHGFTHFVEGNSPERVVRILNEYMKTVTEVILENGGYLDKYLGDGIMALFGAFEDDPEKAALAACRTALETQQRLEAFTAKYSDLHNALQETRIGIASGNAVVGNVGSEQRWDYTAIGDSVNVAARLQTLNKKTNTLVLVDDETEKLVGAGFELLSLGAHKVEGRDHSVEIFELADSKGGTFRRRKKEVPPEA